MVVMGTCEEQAAVKPRDAQYQNTIFTFFFTWTAEDKTWKDGHTEFVREHFSMAGKVFETSDPAG